MTALGQEPGTGAEDAELLERVRDTAVAVLAALPRSPERLRIWAGGIGIEVDWATSGTTAEPGAVRATPAAPEPAATTDNGAPAGPRITSPSVGTFYRSPEPGADPFVKVGDQVKPGQQVAIVEAMKLMLPVEADAGGVVTEVLVDDGQPVEYGQDLLALGPAA